jgi:hypothetical protein
MFIDIDYLLSLDIQKLESEIAKIDSDVLINQLKQVSEINKKELILTRISTILGDNYVSLMRIALQS